MNFLAAPRLVFKKFRQKSLCFQNPTVWYKIQKCARNPNPTYKTKLWINITAKISTKNAFQQYFWEAIDSQTKIYPVQNWSVEKPIGAFLQTTAPVLDKIYGLIGGWFLSSAGLGSGTVIGGREFLSAPSLDKIISLIDCVIITKHSSF